MKRLYRKLKKRFTKLIKRNNNLDGGKIIKDIFDVFRFIENKPEFSDALLDLWQFIEQFIQCL